MNPGAATAAIAALTMLTLGVFLTSRLFPRKRRKGPRGRRIGAFAALVPVALAAGYGAFTVGHSALNGAYRKLQRSGTFLIKNARVFTGERTLERASVLVKDGKIAAVLEDGQAADGDVETIDGTGKTLLPGLIDAHVHLSAPGALSKDREDYEPERAMARAAEAMVYSGVTAARVVGDGLKASLKLRDRIAAGSVLGAQLFVAGPVFAGQAGRGVEHLDWAPAEIREPLKREAARTPRTPEEARRLVRELRSAGVDEIKAVLEARWSGGDRVDLLLMRTVAEEARALKLRVATHTGDARDVADAVEIGSTSVEHGSWQDELPQGLLERMAAKGTYYVPTLAMEEGYARLYAGDRAALEDGVARRVLPERMAAATRARLKARPGDAAKAAWFRQRLETSRANLLRAWSAGVRLALGTDAGNPLVLHGAAVHRELRLWVEAGLPAEAALRAATSGAAALMGAGNRIGGIRKGMDADLVLVEGNPLTNIGDSARIALIVYKGERLDPERRGE